MKNIMMLIVTFLFLSSCNTEPTYETRPENPAEPTFNIEDEEIYASQGISTPVDGDVIFKMSVTAESGLTSMYINDVKVKNFTYGQVKEKFEYSFKMPDVADTTLVFSIVDELGKKVLSAPITITAKGRISNDFLLADMQGEYLGTTEMPLPMAPTASIYQEKFAIKSDMEDCTYAFMRRLNDTGVFKKPFYFAQDDPMGGDEKCLKIVKEGTALNFQIKFDSCLPTALIEDIHSGKRKLIMDIYIQNNELPKTCNFTVYFANFDKYKNDNSGMVKDCVSIWTFDESNLNKWNEAQFSLGSGNTGKGSNIQTSDVNMLVIKPTTGTIHGPYFIKNIRIVKI